VAGKTVSDKVVKGRLLTQHTGLPPRAGTASRASGKPGKPR